MQRATLSAARFVKSNLMTIIQLRWFALAGVVIMLLLARLLGLYAVQMVSGYAVLAYAATNLVARSLLNKIRTQWIHAVIFFLILFDLTYLTLLLVFNGGAHNPFAILFIAIGSAAAMTLPRRYLVLVIFSSLVCLWRVYSGNSHMMWQGHFTDAYAFHLQGMWLANSIAVIVVSFWVYHLRMQNEIISARHEESQRILSHIEKVESMGRLLAATAHQLNTPLGTLQLGISELANTDLPLSEAEKNQWLVDLQSSLGQITGILSTVKSGEKSGGNLFSQQRMSLSHYVSEVANRWAKLRNYSVEISDGSAGLLVAHKHLDELGPCFEAVLENAYEAGNANTRKHITVGIKNADTYIKIGIQDFGPGMDEITKSRALEPLYTTKKSGTGLGLYLCHKLATRWGGGVEIDSKLGLGTTVTLIILREALV